MQPAATTIRIMRVNKNVQFVFSFTSIAYIHVELKGCQILLNVAIL